MIDFVYHPLGLSLRKVSRALKALWILALTQSYDLLAELQEWDVV